MSAPARPHVPWTDDLPVRDLLWFAYGSGVENPTAPPEAGPEEPPADRFEPPPPPSWVRTGQRRALPRDVRRRLEHMPYPRLGRSDGDGDSGALLGTAFGLQWHDLEGPYNAHRCYASPRCSYPVQVLAAHHGRWSMLDVDGHALVVGPGSSVDRRIALTGRWTRLPGYYRHGRSTLVALELGITLRALAVGMALTGVTGRVHPPGPAGRDLLEEARLVPAGQWSLPVVIDLGAGAAASPAPVPTPPPAATPLPTATAPSAPSAPTAPPAATSSDVPALARIEAIDRAQAFPPDPARLDRAVPDALDAPPDGPSWAEVLWRRTSGRTIRGKHGFGARPARLPGPDVAGMLAWARVPPPGADLAAARTHITLSVAVQGVDGLLDGVYDVPDAPGDPLELRHVAPDVLARLEPHYAHRAEPDVGCDVRYCSAVWFLMLRPRPLMTELGPGGWSAGLRAVGWIAHGLCLGAAAAGRFARPVREFQEEPTLRLLGRDADEMLPLSVLVGTGRHGSSGLLDLRP